MRIYSYHKLELVHQVKEILNFEADIFRKYVQVITKAI